MRLLEFVGHADVKILYKSCVDELRGKLFVMVWKTVA